MLAVLKNCRIGCSPDVVDTIRSFGITILHMHVMAENRLYCECLGSDEELDKFMKWAKESKQYITITF